jgi:hypothetical protein
MHNVYPGRFLFPVKQALKTISHSRNHCQINPQDHRFDFRRRLLHRRFVLDVAVHPHTHVPVAALH